MAVVVEDRISALETLDRFRCPHCNSTSPPRLVGAGSVCWEDLIRAPSSDVHDPPLNPFPEMELGVMVVVVSSWGDLEGEGLK